MVEENRVEKGAEIFQKLTDTLDAMGWKYQRVKENAVRYKVMGEDIPMEFLFRVDPERHMVSNMSILPVKFSEDKRMDGILACCSASFGLRDGVFSCDVEKGNVVYNCSSFYTGCEVSDAWFQSIMSMSHIIVDTYNDRFLMLAKGIITLEDFMKE